MLLPKLPISQPLICFPPHTPPLVCTQQCIIALYIFLMPSLCKHFVSSLKSVIFIWFDVALDDEDDAHSSHCPICSRVCHISALRLTELQHHMSLCECCKDCCTTFTWVHAIFHPQAACSFLKQGKPKNLSSGTETNKKKVSYRQQFVSFSKPSINIASMLFSVLCRDVVILPFFSIVMK